jgi:leucyl aminopeptidase (aminopeptidase T)
VATLPGVTADMLARMMTADVAELRRRGHALAEALTAASEAVLTSAEGTDLRMSLEGRSGIADAGEITAPGAFGNLPCGEGFIGPLEEAADGALVIDGTIAAYGRVPEPTRLELRDGRIVRAAGAAGQWLLDRLSAHGPEATGIAELGIGTNERAVLSGNVLEDEKLLGTVHIAFGASAGIGGVVQVPIHLDCVVMSPTLALDGEVILRDGRLLV